MQPSDFTADPVTSMPSTSSRLSCDRSVSPPTGCQTLGNTGANPHVPGFSGHNLGPLPQSSYQTLNTSLPHQRLNQQQQQQQNQPQPGQHVSQPSLPGENRFQDFSDLSNSSLQMSSQDIQQLFEQQALISQIQNQMLLEQVRNSPVGLAASSSSQPFPLGQQGQLMGNSMPLQQIAPGSHSSSWPSFQTSTSPVGSPLTPGASPIRPGIALPEPQGAKTGNQTPIHDEKRRNRNSGHATPPDRHRPADTDHQSGTIDKLRREVSRLHAELEKMEKEVQRQKTLREHERQEFTETKERLKHSWAADRDDFARVKTHLKTKNAEHHAQSSRLSQSLKEIEAANRTLCDLLTRNNIPVPTELDFGTLRRHSPVSSTGKAAMTPQGSHQLSNDASHASGPVSDVSYDSDEFSGPRVKIGRGPSPLNSQPQSPESPANAILNMVHQLQSVLPSTRVVKESGGVDATKLLDVEDNAMAAEAATHAASALGQLAVALSKRQPAHPDPAKTSSPSHSQLPDSGRHAQEDGHPSREEVEGEELFELPHTNLNQMSLAAWVRDMKPQPPSPSLSSPGATGGLSVPSLEFHPDPRAMVP